MSVTDYNEAARELVEETYREGCGWHGPIITAHCGDLHKQRLVDRITTALQSAHEAGKVAERERIKELALEVYAGPATLLTAIENARPKGES